MNFEKSEFLIQNPSSNIIKTKTLNFFKKYNIIKEGSVVSSIITFMKISLGIGFFTLPHYIKNLGILNSIIIILLNSILTFFSFKFIFEASEKTSKSNFQDIVKNLLGGFFYNVSIVTLFLDYFSSILVEFIMSWNLLQYLLFFCGFFKNEWVLDLKTLQFNENNLEISILRFCYFSILFFVSKNKLKNGKFEKMRYLSFYYLVTIISIIFFLLYQMPYYKNQYINNNQLEINYLFTKPSFKWLQASFSILGCFNSQIYILDIKKELKIPNLSNLNKIVKIGIIYEVLIFSIMGITCYYSLGNKFTPQLILLRKPLSIFFFMEIIMKILIFIYFSITVLGLPLNILSFKNLILDIFYFRNNQTISTYWKNFVSFSIFIFISIFAVLYPNIINIFSIFGISIWSIDAIVFPFLFKIKLIERENGSKNVIFFLYLVIFLIMSCGIYRLIHNIYYL